MTPFLLAYPRDEADVRAAVAFAQAKNKRVVARSGGHQYSGKSSGGGDTLVLAMDAFNHFLDVADGVVEVGPAVPLTSLAAQLKQRGITVPHGECPLVCVGGHAQTGGYGHLLRGFGLMSDHVAAFTIVLADGTTRTVQRPAGHPATEDDFLFWGVLGGNAGSFGVVTSYQLKCVKDDAHPQSYRYAATRRYERSRYHGLMKEVQQWTQRVADGSLPADKDFMMTVESQSGLLPFPVLIVDLVHSNLGGAGQQFDADSEFDSVIRAADAQTFPFERPWTEKGTLPLSAISDSFVRRYPETTWDGREFRYPYKKRINCTSGAITDEFVERFVALVDKVVADTDGVYLVFQMLIGGGNYKHSARRVETAAPRRDFVYCVIFDLFYDAGKENRAAQLQAEMQAVIDAHFSGGQEQRLFWGSFGSTDMADPAVQACYYDDAAAYLRLRELKKRVDKDDVFGSSFSVKLP